MRYGGSFMKLGVCAGIDSAQAVSDAGYDYIEGGLHVIAKMSREQLVQNKEYLDDCNIKMEATNLFFPGEIHLAGEDADLQKISDYVHRAFDNAVFLGVPCFCQRTEHLLRRFAA